MDTFETAKQNFLDGLQLLQANNFPGAEQKFTQSLELLPDRLSTLNNLSAVKLKLKKFPEAGELARKAIAVDGKSPEAWSNLGIALAAAKCPEEALAAHDRALKVNPGYARAWLNKAMVLLELKRFDEALLACDEAVKLSPPEYENLYTKSLILKELQRPEEAQKIYLKSLEVRIAVSPVFPSDRSPTQKADVLVISHNPVTDASLKSFETLHLQCTNYPGQLARLFQEDFHFTYIFEGVVTRRTARNQIPRPDLVINNSTNAEVVFQEGELSELTEAVNSFGVPVINHPAKAAHTTRDESAKLVANISGVRVPKTMRFSSLGKTRDEVVHEIEGQYQYPLITRTLVSQESKGMTKVDSREALNQVLSAGLPENFFVTEFVDSRGGKEFYRKMRASVVKDEIVIVRSEYDSYWSVHGRKTDGRVAFYQRNTGLLDEEKRICADPEVELGRSAIQALRAIRERIPLDVFGIDFDVDAEGVVIFYEANATMNLLSTARSEVPYPEAAEENLRQIFHRYLTSLVGRR